MQISIPALFLSLPLATQGNYFPRADLEEGRFLKALADAEGQIKVNPRNPLAWAAKAQSLSAFLNFGDALDAANRSLLLDSNLPDAYLARGLARGGSAIQKRNFGSLKKASGALADLKRATELDPTLVPAWISLGLAYQQMPGILGGSTRKALNCALALHKVNPGKGDLLRGLILGLENRWAEAQTCFDRALLALPSDPQVVAGYLDTLGSRESREVLGEAEQRTRLVKEARRLLPGMRTQAKGLESICDALLDGGQPEEAWKIAFDSLQKVDKPSLIRLQLGKIAAKSGIHLQEGMTFLEQVLREPLEGGSGGYASAWWRKGQILKDLNQLPAARQCALEALKVDPKHPGSTRLLKDLS